MHLVNVIPLDATYSPFNFSPVAIAVTSGSLPQLDPDLRRLAEERGKAVLEKGAAAVHAAGWKLPIDYRYFSASFDGLYVKFMLPIKRYFPRDWQRICEFFPLIELEVLRYESAVAHGQQPAYAEPAGPHPYL